MGYQIYKNHHGAMFLVNGYNIKEETVTLMGLRTCSIFIAHREELQSNYTYVGYQVGHPLIYGVVCDKEGKNNAN